MPNKKYIHVLIFYLMHFEYVYFILESKCRIIFTAILIAYTHSISNMEIERYFSNEVFFPSMSTY